MSNERIELTQFENISSEGWKYLSDESRDINDAALDKIPDLIAELKRMYEREDALVSAIKELYYSEDNTGCSEDLTVVSLVAVLKLRDLTSE